MKINPILGKTEFVYFYFNYKQANLDPEALYWTELSNRENILKHNIKESQRKNILEKLCGSTRRTLSLIYSTLKYGIALWFTIHRVFKVDMCNSIE